MSEWEEGRRGWIVAERIGKAALLALPRFYCTWGCTGENGEAVRGNPSETGSLDSLYHFLGEDGFIFIYVIYAQEPYRAVDL